MDVSHLADQLRQLTLVFVAAIPCSDIQSDQNKETIRLLSCSQIAAFAYSLLQIVPRSYTRSEVLKLERRYKEKLGRKATDLNGN